MTKLIPILSGRCLVVELPEGQQPMGLWTIEPNRLFYVDKNGCDTNIALPPGKWRIIGMLSEVTEDQLFNLVDWYHVSDNMDLTATYAFKDYVNGEDDAEDYWDEYMMDTALESLESAIEAGGYYLDENPLGNRPEMDASTDDDLDDFDFPNERGRKKWDEWEDEYKKWNEAQSRVLCRERCLLLGREDV